MKSVFCLSLKWCATPAIVVLMTASNGLRAEEKAADKKADPSAKTVNTESSPAKQAYDGKPLPTDAELKKALTPIQYAVTQESGTERPFTNEFWQHKEEGIYVDIVSGTPLFSSKDKFDTDCGWPGFAKPISDDEVKDIIDRTHGMVRTEVRSATADSHLGHVFNDGPKELGGLRYCINSAALRFVPKDKMKEAGYGTLHEKIFGGGKAEGQQTAAKKEETKGATAQ